MAQMTSTVASMLRKAVGELSQAGVDSPELDAELLLAHVLNVERSWLLAHPEFQPDPKQQARFRRLLARRVAREPLAYITGQRWFYDILLHVPPGVLIPRLETEELVERALNWLLDHPRAVVVDVGTGSGAIALAVAKHAPQAIIYATDDNPFALDVALENAHRLNLGQRITFLSGDLLAPLPEPVDLILANLPYISLHLRPGLMPEVRDFEPPEALFSGESGLGHIARLLAQARHHIRPGGMILVEIGHDQGAVAAQLAQDAFPRATVTIHPDLAGRDRLVAIQRSEVGGSESESR